jgi:hypothetical protein
MPPIAEIGVAPVPPLTQVRDERVEVDAEEAGRPSTKMARLSSSERSGRSRRISIGSGHAPSWCGQSLAHSTWSAPTVSTVRAQPHVGRLAGDHALVTELRTRAAPAIAETSAIFS